MNSSNRYVTHKRIYNKGTKPRQMNTITYTPEKRIKIAIVQTGSWGDNINSTLMLKPILEHYNDECSIDIFTSTTYGSAFHNNQYISRIFEYPSRDKDSALHLLITIPDSIQRDNYEKVFIPHPMINPGKWSSSLYPELGENLIYAWVNSLESEGIKCDMPPTSVLRLTADEISSIDSYCSKIPAMNTMRNILMECHGESGQTFWDHKWTISVCEYLLADNRTNIFISRKDHSSDIEQLRKISSNKVHFVGGLSIRQCAELFNRCEIFFSVSSGLSNACNTNWCRKDIKWVETTNSSAVTSAPIRKDGKIFWHDNDIPKFMNILKENGI